MSTKILHIGAVAAPPIPAAIAGTWVIKDVRGGYFFAFMPDMPVPVPVCVPELENAAMVNKETAEMVASVLIDEYPAAGFTMINLTPANPV